MELISTLRNYLYKALSPANVQFDEQELFDELLVTKPRLLKLLDVGSRNENEQKEIQSGKTVIHGKQIAINGEFAKQVLFLSQQLECSERYVAGLLDEVMKENPNIDPVTSLELTVELFHLRRRHLVDSLRYLVDATEFAEAFQHSQSSTTTTSGNGTATTTTTTSGNDVSGDEIGNVTYTRLARFFVNELVVEMKDGSGEALTLAMRIWNQIEQLNELIGRADNARRGAGSNTIALTPGSPSLGFDILNSRYDSLKYERRYLAIVLCSISHLGYLTSKEIKLLVEWLSTNPSHPMTYYFLTAVLLAFDPINPSSASGKLRLNLVSDASIITFMTNILAPSKEWKESGLKATILLKWTMLLTEARHNNPTFEHKPGFKTEELETQVWNGVQGDAFTYLRTSVQNLLARRSPSTSPLSFNNEGQELREIPPDDFREVILVAFEALLRSIITHASSELRKIKQRQEDLVHARDRTRTSSARFSTTLPVEPERTDLPQPRSDIAALYTLIGTLYSALPPERGLQFWGASPGGPSRLSYIEYVETTTGRLPAFLQWAVWSTSIQDLTILTALYEMLSGLAKGQQCSELAYNFMARGGGEVLPGSSLPPTSSSGPSISWFAVFGLLDNWATSAASARGAPQPQSFGLTNSFGGGLFNAPVSKLASQQFTIGPKEVLYAQSFLQLLSNVVKYSVAVRTAVSSHAQFRAIPTLVSLIPFGIPLELKGAIFNTLAAFCEPGAGIPGVEICKAVWTLMERLEVINVRAPISAGLGVLATGKGVELELEQIEAVHRLYPATIPFLRLLGTLIHTPKRITKDKIAELEPVNTIPDNLGQPYRIAGIGPFACFVIDNVFANIPNRDYSQPSDRWQINDLCLTFVERCLASYDLEPLVSTTEEISTIKAEKLMPLVIHPGYDIMKRLLSSSPLRESLLSYIVEGVEGFDRNLADEEPFFKNTIVRVLRIIQRVLEIQDLFLDVLVPLLSELVNPSFASVIQPRSHYTRFDQALAYGTQFIPAIATYMSYPSHSELALLSIKILSALCGSANSASIVMLIERSRDSERILNGFMRIVGTESLDDVWDSETFGDEVTGAGAPDPIEDPYLLAQAIRLAALEFLIQNTEQDKSYPNIAHYFLFGGSVKEQRIQDPHALGAHHTTIHAILKLLNMGIPKVKGKDKEVGRDVTPLLVMLPGLAERCYRVIHNLCVHPRTSDFTTRYLRTREDFFARQLASMPSAVPETLQTQEPLIQVVYEDGNRVTTTVPTLCAFLRLRSYIFNLVALELHVLTNKGQFKGVSELLDILFGTDVDYEEEFGFQTFRDVGQSQMKIIDFLQSLMFDWADSLIVQPRTLQYLNNLNLQASIRQDASGCDIVDRTAVLSLLSNAKRILQSQGAITTAAHWEQANKEATYILESCVVENHRRKVAHALVDGIENWKRLLDMALMKCFDRLPHDRRENMLFDLLHVLPSAIRSGNMQESVSVLLAETVLSSITKLREDRQHQVILQSVGGNVEAGSLPAERLFNILRNILEGILDSNRVELVRGNLYAALINFIHLVASGNEIGVGEGFSGNVGLNSSLSLGKSALGQSSFTQSQFFSGSINNRSLSFNPNQSLIALSSSRNRQLSPSPSTTSNSNAYALLAGSLATMKDVIEKLVAVLARDAIDGTEVWKTIAFMLLDALVQLAGQEKHSVVVSALTRHGILANFVRGVKESDGRLQSVLKPEPDDLNPLYVYEAKMSLFTRMSQTRTGAERLLESQIIPVLAQCDYLDSRPEGDQSFIDQDSFLPSAVQRYHQLLMPALQVLGGMIATLGNKHSTVTKQVLDFLSSHGSTLVILLKNEADHTSLSVLDEIHLIISLCTHVLPSVPKSEIMSPNSGFGAIHAAILSLGSRSLSQSRCFIGVGPQNEAELLDVNTPAFGNVSESRFDVHLRSKERLLRKAIVAYIGAASDFTEPEITLVLSPLTNTTRIDERGAHFLATVPTVGDTIEALETITEDISNTLRQISDLGAELANRDHIVVDGVQDVLRNVQVGLLQELDIEQKRSLICQEIEKVREGAKGSAKILFDTMEMLLLLLWRHLEYYAEPSNMNIPPPKTTLINAMRLLASSNPEQFRQEIVMKIGPLLQKLSTLDIGEECLGRDWQANQAYIEIMTRRLRDSVGLLVEDASDSR